MRFIDLLLLPIETLYVMALVLGYVLLASVYIFGYLIRLLFYGLKSALRRATSSGLLRKVIENGLVIWYGSEESF